MVTNDFETDRVKDNIDENRYQSSSDITVPDSIFEEINRAIESAKCRFVNKIDIHVQMQLAIYISSPPCYQLIGNAWLDNSYTIHVRTLNALNRYVKTLEEFYKGKYNVQISSTTSSLVRKNIVVRISW